jgi:hydroxymethylpyrimidine kinase/phosphomethylpyrimidine kinase
VKRILTVAGSDSGGGAGIQADLKTITLLGGFGMSVITALTAQNTLGVQGIREVPGSFVEKQIDAVLKDIGADAVKTGMLANAEIVKVASQKIRSYRIKRLIVDPVMVAKSGDVLLSHNAHEYLKSHLLPLALVATPNIEEASALCGLEIKDVNGMKKAARALHRMGPKNVVIKGGHLDRGEALDLLYDGREFFEYNAERIETKDTHGTGCCHSAAISTFIAQGYSVTEAVREAKLFITDAIRFSLNIGNGYGPINPYVAPGREMARYEVIQVLKNAVYLLKQSALAALIPEVQSNLGYALPYARSVHDIAAIPGRIIALKDTITTVSDPEFGASRHIAQVILTVMRRHPDMRSAMNIRFDKSLIKRCKSLKMRVRSFDRRHEPRDVKEREGLSLAWGVESILKREKAVPDIIFDGGELGKEPMIRVIGRDPIHVVQRIQEIGGLTRI